MISEFRKRFQGEDSKSTMTWVAVLFAAGIFLPQVMQRYKLDSNSILSVDGESVPLEQFRSRVRRESLFIDILRSQFGGIDLRQLGINDDPVRRALESLTQDLILKNTANDINLVLNDETVRRKILQMLPAGKTLKDIAKEQHVKVSELEGEIKQEILNSIVMKLSLGGLYVPSFAVKQKYQQDFGKKKFQILKFKKDKDIKEPSEKDISQYYDKAIKDGMFKVPEQREVEIFEFDSSRSKAQVTDAELLGAYNKHKGEFVKNKPQVSVKVIKGEADKLSKLNSKDLDNEELMKDLKVELLPLFKRGTHSSQLEKEAFALDAKELSNILEENGERYRLYLVERVGTQYKKLEEVRPELKKIVLEGKISTMLKDLDLKDIDEFVKNNGGVAKTIKADNPNESTLAKKAFDLKEGEAAKHGDKQLIVLRKITPSRVLTLKESKKDITSKLKNESLDKALQEKLEKAEAMKDKISFKEIAKELAAELNETGWINQQDKDYLPEMNGINDLHESKSFILEDGGYLVRLTGISDQADDFKDKEKEIKADLLGQYSNSLKEGFIASLQRNAKIKINDKIFNG